MNANRLIRRLSVTVLAIYFATIVHHVDEGLGLIFGFRLQSLITPLTFAIPLLMTLAFLRLYEMTRQPLFLAGFATSTLYWVVGIGLTDGLYNHTLPLLLTVARVPAGILEAIYPTYLAPAAGRPLQMACDGVRFSYCAVTPATVVYEVAGIASFAIACSFAVDAYRLVRNWPRDRLGSLPLLPRSVAVGASIGMLTSFAVAPLLGMYMASGKPALLIVTLTFLAVGLAALAMAAATTRARVREGALTK